MDEIRDDTHISIAGGFRKGVSHWVGHRARLQPPTIAAIEPVAALGKHGNKAPVNLGAMR